MFVDQTKAREAYVQKVEERRVVRGWRRDEVTRCCYGGEAVVAGEKEGVDGGGDRGDVWGVEERRRDRGGGEDVVGGWILEEGEVL